MTKSYRSRRRWWGCGLRAAARAAGVERRNRPLGAGRTGVGADEPAGVDHRRDARRELEDEPDGRALLGRGDRRAGGLWRGISEPWSTSSPAHRSWSTDPSESVTGFVKLADLVRSGTEQPSELQGKRGALHGHHHSWIARGRRAVHDCFTERGGPAVFDRNRHLGVGVRRRRSLAGSPKTPEVLQYRAL